MASTVGTFSDTAGDTSFVLLSNPGMVFSTMGDLLAYVGNSQPSGPYTIQVKGLPSGATRTFTLQYTAAGTIILVDVNGNQLTDVNGNLLVSA